MKIDEIDFHMIAFTFTLLAIRFYNYLTISLLSSYGILLHQAPCIEITKATFKTRDVH